MRAFVEIQMRAALMGNDLQATPRAVLQNIAASLGLGAMEFAHIEAVLRMRRQGQPAAPGARARQTRRRSWRRPTRCWNARRRTATRSSRLAYRRQLSRHHPDKLKANGLPDSMIEHAKQRTQQIIEAWELVRERRGI